MVSDVSARLSGQSSAVKHIFVQLQSLGKYLIFLALLIPAFFLIDTRHRAIVLLIILPILILWAYYASYDFRNLSLMLPLLGLVIGLLFEKFGSFANSLLTLLRFEKWNNFLWILLAAATLIGISLKITSTGLIEKQYSEQKLIFDPSKNDLLYELIPDFEPGVKVLTNYPVNKLPGLENNQTTFWFNNYEEFIDAIDEDKNIKLVFVPSYASPAISEYLEKSVAKGTAKFIFESKSWIPYTMYQLFR